MSKKIENLLEFEDQFNPQHFYCRLKDLGMVKKKARQYSERYEIEIYIPIMEELKNKNIRNK